MAVLFAVVQAAGGVQSAFAYRVSFGVGTLVTFVGLAASFQLARVLERARERSRTSQAPGALR
jgi:hypothetical protein